MSDSLLTQAPQQRALQELLLCTRHLFPCPPPQLTNNTQTFGSNGSGKQSLSKTSRKNLTYPTVVHFFFFFFIEHYNKNYKIICTRYTTFYQAQKLNLSHLFNMFWTILYIYTKLWIRLKILHYFARGEHTHKNIITANFQNPEQNSNWFSKKPFSRIMKSLEETQVRKQALNI